MVTRLTLYHNESTYGLWVIYALSTPLSGVIIPIGFTSYLPCKLYCRDHKTGKELDGTAEPTSVTTKQLLNTSTNEEHSEAKQNKESMKVQPTEREPLLGQRVRPTCTHM